MQIRHVALDTLDVHSISRKTQQCTTQIVRVWRACKCACRKERLSIGLEKGDVNAVHRRTAHQADCSKSFSRCPHEWVDLRRSNRLSLTETSRITGMRLVLMTSLRLAVHRK